MINLTNYIAGRLIRILSVLTVWFKPSLKSQLIFIKNNIAIANKRKKKIPKQLLNSIIKIEDKRFFCHLGVDLYSIMRALLRNTTTNRFEGASTIVQQLIRNIIDEREITFKRKFKEIIFASLINKEFTKGEILFAYFHTYRFKNCIGIFNFCQVEDYDIENLTINESAQIAARFKYPYVYHNNYIKYLKRVRTIERKICSDFESSEEKLNETVMALKEQNNSLHTQLFLVNYKIEKIKFYLNICLRDKTQSKFLKGWIRRAME